MSAVGNEKEDVSVARLVQRAVAGQVTAAELTLDVIDAHPEAAGQQVLAVTTNRLGSTKLQGMRVAPLRRTGDHDDVRRQPCTFATRSLEPLWHGARVFHAPN